jgi:membrane protein DedA with SNARE-associated domain
MRPIDPKRRMLILVGVAVAAAAVYAGGRIGLPGPETVLRDVTGALGAYTYVVVGALAFLETGAGIGLVAPGEIAVMLGGVSAGHGEIQLVPLIVLVWACAFAGDLTTFVLGRRLGRTFLLRHGTRLGLTEQRLEQIERHFAAHGGKTIIVGRFIGLVRAVAPFVAGASNMPARRFIPYTAIASGIWAVTFCVLGFVFWRSLDQLIAIIRQGTFVLVAVVVVAVAGVTLHRRRRGLKTG